MDEGGEPPAELGPHACGQGLDGGECGAGHGRLGARRADDVRAGWLQRHDARAVEGGADPEPDAAEAVQDGARDHHGPARRDEPERAVPVSRHVGDGTAVDRDECGWLCGAGGSEGRVLRARQLLGGEGALQPPLRAPAAVGGQEAEAPAAAARERGVRREQGVREQRDRQGHESDRVVAARLRQRAGRAAPAEAFWAWR